ncbi:MAG: hypothetical protein IIZ39_01560, partial [Blautia sp.]|nr:hypothetical protein [Blautia sp.]
TTPTDEPMVRYTGSNSNIGLLQMLGFISNPFAKDNYYQVDIPKESFITYSKGLDANLCRDRRRLSG